MTLKIPHETDVHTDSLPASDPVRAAVESHLGGRNEGNGPPSDTIDPEYDLPYSDRERLGQVLTSLQPRLTAVALRITRDPQSAEDILQLAFEKVLRNGHRYRGEARVSTWLHRIVVNEALMWLRSQRRRTRLVTSEIPAQPAIDEGPGPGELLEAQRRRDQLRNGLDQLQPEDRDLIEHCAIMGLSYAEYAQSTGMHPAAVKSRAHRARRRLRHWLEQTLDSHRELHA